MKLPDEFSLEGDTRLYFIGADSIDHCCSNDCERYIEFFRKSLSFRSESKKLSIRLSEGNIEANVELFMGNDYAIMDLSERRAEYLRKIGNGTRSLIKRSINNGYKFSEFDARNFDHDLRSILASSKIRSGRPVPAEWHDKNYQIPVWTKGLCDRHKEHSFGVFDRFGKIISFCTLRFFGEVASFNYIVGHAEYLSSGVMHFLIDSLRSYLTEKRPEVNYLHYMWMGDPSYASYYSFKSGAGFRKAKICLVERYLPLASFRKLNYAPLSEDNNINTGPYEKVKKNNKLFKISLRPKGVEIVDVQDVRQLVVLSLNYFLRDDLVSVVGEHALHSIGNDDLFSFDDFSLKFFNNKAVYCLGPRFIEFHNCFYILNNFFGDRTKRGDVLFLLLKSSDFNYKSLNDLILRFKGGSFQILDYYCASINRVVHILCLIIKL